MGDGGSVAGSLAVGLWIWISMWRGSLRRNSALYGPVGDSNTRVAVDYFLHIFMKPTDRPTLRRCSHDVNAAKKQEP